MTYPKRDLLKEYPDLIEVCRKHDCDYQTGIKIIKNKGNTLDRFLSPEDGEDDRSDEHQDRDY